MLEALASLRADLLNAETMPATWQFAADKHRFTAHYSGGNGTRAGMFSMREDGERWVRSGATAPEEILRVTRDASTCRLPRAGTQV